MKYALTAIAISACVFPTAVLAQEHDHSAMAAEGKWVWSTQGQAFLNLNLQTREFRDFNQVESQNWLMVATTRKTGRAQWTIHAMASAEPWTLRREGSAQVFQAGETLDGAPLIDYQHPHDLVMGLEARLDWAASPRTTLFVSAGPVGSPSLGPGPFMHRSSASPNPTAPLSHHMLDSQHSSTAVALFGVTRDAWTVDASVFHGRESDENRLDVDVGPPDSVAARVAWQRGAWHAQVSSAHINEPESVEPGDVVRTTASLTYARGAAGARTAWMAAWGRNDRPDHGETGWLVEGQRDLTARVVIYTRAELVDRFILVDFDHAIHFGEERHLRSQIAAWTLGSEYRLRTTTRTQTALGADVTFHRTPRNLRESYGSPVSVHLFVQVGTR